MTKTIIRNIEDFKIAGKTLKVRKRPVVIRAVEMDRAFEVQTMENRNGETMHGKAGDYLLEGVDGEIYPYDGAIFHKTYDIIGEKKKKE